MIVRDCVQQDNGSLNLSLVRRVSSFVLQSDSSIPKRILLCFYKPGFERFLVGTLGKTYLYFTVSQRDVWFES